MWTSTYDPVRLQPKPGQSRPLEQLHVHLLDVRYTKGVQVFDEKEHLNIISAIIISIKALVQLQWVLHYVYYIYAMMFFMQQNHSTDQYM